LTNVISGMLTMFYKIKIHFFLIYLIGANVMLAASHISLGSLLPVNHLKYFVVVVQSPTSTFHNFFFWLFISVFVVCLVIIEALRRP
jgi:hypothetical protein